MLSGGGSFIKWNAVGVCFPVFVPEWYLPGVLCGVSCSVVMVLDCLHLPAFLFQVSCCLYTPTVCLCDVIFIDFLSMYDSVSFVVHPIHLPRWMRGRSVFFWKNHIPKFPSPSLSLSMLSFPQTWLLESSQPVFSLSCWCRQAVAQLHWEGRVNWEAPSFHSQVPQTWEGVVE